MQEVNYLNLIDAIASVSKGKVNDVLTSWVRVLSYPKIDVDRFLSISKELLKAGVTKLVSYGDVNVGKVRIVGKGHASVVILGVHSKSGLVAIKVRRVDSKTDTLMMECKALQRAFPISPKVIYCSDDVIIREYVVGVPLEHVINSISSCIEAAITVYHILTAAFWLDLMGIDHKELSLPGRHIFICRDRKVKIIDFDSVSFRKSHNVCKVFSWVIIRRQLLRKLCKDYSSELEKEMLRLIRLYKKGSVRAFILICDLLGGFIKP